MPYLHFLKCRQDFFVTNANPNTNILTYKNAYKIPGIHLLLCCSFCHSVEHTGHHYFLHTVFFEHFRAQWLTSLWILRITAAMQPPARMLALGDRDFSLPFTDVSQSHKTRPGHSWYAGNICWMKECTALNEISRFWTYNILFWNELC